MTQDNQDKIKDPKKEKQIKKIAGFIDDKNFAIFEEISEVNETLKQVINAINESKQTEISIDNTDDLKVDLSPLEDQLTTLKGAVETVTESIKSKKDIDMSGVENLLSKIVNKESKEIDVSELSNISNILSDVLFAVQTTASTTDIEKEELVPELKSIQSILDVLNENIISIPEFDYEKLAKVIKSNLKIKAIGGGGPAVINLKNVADTVINPATEEKQDTAIAELQKLIGFEIPAYDYIALTYVSSGNGAGEIETVVYKSGGSGGTTEATLTLAYGSNGEISSITKT